MTDERRARPEEMATPEKLEPLLELARRELTEAEPRRAASLAALEQRLEKLTGRRRRIALWPGVLATLVAAICIGWFALEQVRSPLEMQVLAGELSRNGQLSPSSTTAAVRFSDGTELWVEPAARAEVASVSARGADIRLQHGQLRLQVAKRPGADWNVLAGAYRVHVTGTSLAVALGEDGENLEVRLFAGAVAVSGPLIDGEIAVSRAQRLSVDGKLRRVRVQPLDVPEVRAAPEALLPEADVARDGVAPAPDARPAAPLGNAARARQRPPRKPAWSSQVAAGKFDDVLSAAEKQGLESVYGRASLDDLSALADAARYGRRHVIARAALLAMRRRFASSAPAKQAAFLLGRLMEDESAPSALEWYERYLQEEPRGVHASQALGRKMLIVYERGGASAAAAIAREYLEHFPDGSYAPSARRIMSAR